MDRSAQIEHRLKVKVRAMKRFLTHEASRDFSTWEREHFDTRVVRDLMVSLELADIQHRERGE